MISDIFAATAMKIAAALVLLLAVFAGVQTVRLAGAREAAARAEAQRARMAAEMVLQARKADAAAQTAVDAGKALSGAEIERGRAAAEKSSGDVWKDATDAMKQGGV